MVVKFEFKSENGRSMPDVKYCVTEAGACHQIIHANRSQIPTDVTINSMTSAEVRRLIVDMV